MKKKLLILVTLLTVVLLCFAACNKVSVADLQEINKLLTADYSRVQVVIDTETEQAKLHGNFILTFDGDETNVEYSFEVLNSFEFDDEGNLVAPDKFTKTVEGKAVVRNGEVIDGEANDKLPLGELKFTGLSFKQAFFNNATIKNAKFEADVSNPQDFTGNKDLVCSDMHVVVYKTATAISRIDLTYVSAENANVSIAYLFVK